MNAVDKELLLKDLCARLPYGIKVQYNNEIYSIDYISALYEEIKLDILDNYTIGISEIKPYLRPMSDMTNEERKEFSKLLDKRYCEEDWEGHISISYCIEIDEVYIDDEDGIKYPTIFSMDAIDYLNSHHFDYRGFIEKGLAIEVTKENNPYK